jgi:chromosome segregation ATPase
MTTNLRSAESLQADLETANREWDLADKRANALQDTIDTLRRDLTIESKNNRILTEARNETERQLQRMRTRAQREHDNFVIKEASADAWKIRAERAERTLSQIDQALAATKAERES